MWAACCAIISLVNEIFPQKSESWKLSTKILDCFTLCLLLIAISLDPFELKPENSLIISSGLNPLLQTNLMVIHPPLIFAFYSTCVWVGCLTISKMVKNYEIWKINEQGLPGTGKVSEDAIKVIARASEGSVRDSISLLDRALISQTIKKDNTIEEKDVREMLGLADRSKVIALFKEVLSGQENEALRYLKELINDGLDAKNFLNDVLEILYPVSYTHLTLPTKRIV